MAGECKLGEKRSCYLLGVAYEKGEASPIAPGEIVVRNTASAAYFHNKGCLLGEMWSCYLLAEQYIKGDGVPRDQSIAANLDSKVCDGPLESCTRMACRALGDLYIGGRGVKTNFRSGLDLLAKSCAMGDSYACRLHDTYGGTGLVSSHDAPEGALGFSFGWSKDDAKTACTKDGGRWSPRPIHDSDDDLCITHSRALDREIDLVGTFIDGHLALIECSYVLDSARAIAEHARVSGLLLDSYGLATKRTWEILDGCGTRSLAACLKDKQATFSAYWEFRDHGHGVSVHLHGLDDGQVLLMLLYSSPAAIKAVGSPGL